MTKTKIKFGRKLPIISLGLMLLFTMGFTAYAHGLETHKTKNLCTDAYYQKWWGSGQCDPSKPKDISGGITKESNPSGLCYPSFNNFTDEAQSNGNGLDPYDTNPALFKDERNFFKAGKVEAGKSFNPSNFVDNLTVKEGDEVLFLVYMHNDGDPCLNEDIKTKSAFLSNWNTTAYGTTLKISGVGSGKIELDKLKTITASIQGTNVVNEYGKVGEPTSDTVTLTPHNGNKYNLELIENSTEYVDMRDDPNFVSWYNTHPITNPSSLFNGTGLPLTTLLVDGKFKSSGGQGVHYASEPYIGIMRFKYKVTKSNPICQDLKLTAPYKLTDVELEKFTGSKNNGPMYKLAIKNLKFSEFPLPAQTKIKFTSTDQNGKFWVADYFGGIGSLGKNSHEVYANQFLQDSLNNQIFYTGEGKVTAMITGLPAEQANVNECSDFVVFEKEVEEKVCKTIFVDHPKTIYKDMVSTFNATVTDQHNEPFLSYVEYSVDYGYGIFMTKYPVGIAPNDSGYVYETQTGGAFTGFIIDEVLGGATGTPKKTIPDPTKGGFSGDLNFGLLSVFDLPILPKNVKDIAVKPKFDPTNVNLDTGNNVDTDTVDTTIEKVYEPAPTSDTDKNKPGSGNPGIDYDPKISGDPSVKKEMSDPTDVEVNNSYVDIKPLDISITKTIPGGVIFIPDYDGYAVDAVDPDEKDNGNGGIFDYDPKIDGDPSVPKKLDVNDLTIDPIADVDPTKSYIDEIQKTLADKYKNLPNPPKYQSIIVPQGTKVFFLALKKGSNVVHVKAVNGAGTPGCQKDYSIEELPKKPVVNKCESLKVNHQTAILDKTISHFSAKGTDPVNGVFYGKITYSVEPGYGTFYTQKPAGDDNPSLPAPDEYTGKFEKPEGGFCEDKVAASNFLAKTFGKAAVIDTTFNPTVTPKAPVTPLITIDPKKSITKDIQNELADKFKNLTDIQGVPAQSGNSITVNPGQVVYFAADLKGKDGKGKIHVEANCTSVGACKRDFDITSLAQNACSELKIIDNPGTIKIGENKEFKLQGKDILGKALPGETKVVWTTNTDGKIEKAKGTLGEYVKFTDSKKEGSVTVGIDPTDVLFSARCKDIVLVKKERTPPPTPETTCRDLDTTLTNKYPTDIKTNTLRIGEIYTISGKPTFTGPTPIASIDYDINPDIGTFILVGSSSAVTKKTIYDGLKFLKATGNLTKEKVTTFMKSMQRMEKTIMAPPVNGVSMFPNEEMYLVIYIDAQQTGRNTLSSKVSKFTNAECADTFPLEIEPKECVNLLVETTGHKFDPTEKFSLLKLTGDYADHNGPIVVKTTCGELSKTGDNGTFSKIITFTKEEVTKLGKSTTFVFKGDKSCEGVTITAEGVGAPAGKCRDTLSKYKPGDDFKCVELNIKTPSYPWIIDDRSDSQFFQVQAITSPAGLQGELDYLWEVEKGGIWKYGAKEGNGVKTSVNFNKLKGIEDKTKVTVYAYKDGKKIDNCYDSIKVKSDEEPQIKKYVYPIGEYNKITDFILNISSPKYLKNQKNQYLTYKIEFANGSEGQVEIREKELKGGALRGLEGYGGKLQYKGMRINVYDGGNNKYTLLKTDGYSDDKDDNGFEENGNGNDIEKYEDDYKCDSGDFTKASTKVVPPRVCIEGNFDIARAKFLEGEPITFRNLKNTTQIFIKIQMKNDTVIDDELCKKLNATKGCGETFKNTASFETDRYTGKDDAKVIVICPYILTRQGGDTFFHDAIETGVDVSKCSSVKSSTGTAITPKTGQNLDIASSGQGDIPEEVKLLLPSHNVCRFSNTKGNLEDYNDVLENFSSTICELKANVAESWKEANIVTAINNNITRIARFGTNLSNANITQMSDLKDLDNAQSGVFIQKGGVLEINLGANTIGPVGEEVPAAQTYIVKGGTLKITSNIKYKTLAPTDFLKPSKIPSAAFIVIDGNIEIDKDVTHIDGILMAVDTTGTGVNGKILNIGAPSEEVLTINGSLIGDVVDLFKNRIGIGDPEKDEGSVTIKYDERILLNTPPGISELIDLKQSIVPKSVNTPIPTEMP